MEITSIYFGIFSFIAIFIYYLLNHKFRIIFLTILSCAFIASYSYYLLIYVLVYAFINYYIGSKIPTARFKKTLFRTGIILNLIQLLILKYASFTVDPILQIFTSNLHISKLSEIVIPVGISYFTLQGIGYLINIKMGWEKPDKKFLNFLLYITFYPKFLSGPIERSNHFLPQLNVIQSFNEQQVVDGLKIALFGFFKKIAIANQIAPFISSTYTNLNSVDESSMWILLLLQPLYLYFDFSGYTDIAIGFSKTFGIEIIPNFNKPFFSENMTTFWKRFHISLSSWFNDYVFKQASFKRRKWGIFATVYALFLTWTLFGVWHGAGWNFMILGLLQALAIIYEYFTKKWRVDLFNKVPDYLRVWIGRLFTYLFYGVSLIFFFSSDISSVLLFFSKLFDFNTSINSMIRVILERIPLSAIALMVFFLLIELIENDFKNVYSKMEFYWLGEQKMKRILRWLIYSSVIALLFVLNSNIKQFIYAQF